MAAVADQSVTKSTPISVFKRNGTNHTTDTPTGDELNYRIECDNTEEGRIEVFSTQEPSRVVVNDWFDKLIVVTNQKNWKNAEVCFGVSSRWYDPLDGGDEKRDRYYFNVYRLYQNGGSYAFVQVSDAKAFKTFGGFDLLSLVPVGSTDDFIRFEATFDDAARSKVLIDVYEDHVKGWNDF
jgi:hypothetical protein